MHRSSETVAHGPGPVGLSGCLNLDEAGTAVALSLLSRFMRHRLPVANAATRRNINRLRRLLEACGERDPVCHSLLEFDRMMSAFRRLENF